MWNSLLRWGPARDHRLPACHLPVPSDLSQFRGGMERGSIFLYGSWEPSGVSLKGFSCERDLARGLETDFLWGATVGSGVVRSLEGKKTIKWEIKSRKYDLILLKPSSTEHHSNLSPFSPSSWNVWLMIFDFLELEAKGRGCIELFLLFQLTKVSGLKKNPFFTPIYWIPIVYHEWGSGPQEQNSNQNPVPALKLLTF